LCRSAGAGPDFSTSRLSTNGSPCRFGIVTGGAPSPADEDDVDRIVIAWRRERPDLDVAPLHVLSRISRLARRLDLARAIAFSERGIEGWEFDVLAALRRAGSPYRLSPGQLVAETLVTSGTMTNRIDRLEERGWAQRSPAPDDRRGVLVRLTPDGLRVVDAALEDLLGRERDILGALTEPERDLLAGLLRRLNTPLEA
jgi:DNA-binding MarR family transcriptional regulator